MSSAANYSTIPDYDDGDKLTHVDGDDVSVWYGSPEPHFRGEHSHERYQIIIMPDVQSSAELLWRGADKIIHSLRCTGAHVCFIGKGIPHALRWETCGALICFCVAERYFLHFSGGVQRHGVFVRRWSDVSSEDILARGLIERICELIRKPICPENYPIGLGASVVAQLLCNSKFCRKTIPQENGLAPYQLDKVLKYIEAHLSESVKVDGLAKALGLSKSYFSRLFTISTGQPPHRYIVKERLKHASALMEEGKMKVAAIAADTGFHDQSHLSKHMHRYKGGS